MKLGLGVACLGFFLVFLLLVLSRQLSHSHSSVHPEPLDSLVSKWALEMEEKDVKTGNDPSKEDEYGAQVEKFEEKSGLKYLLYTPKAHGSDSGKSWPLLVFLHGAGESGRGSAKGIIAEGITGCPPVELHYKRASATLYNNFVVASPRTYQGWSRHSIETFTKQIIGSKDLYIDSKRVYLTGVSMGGAGVWRAAGLGLFAALVPVCAAGMVNPKNISAPVWAFHGANDVVVPVEYTDRNIATLKKSNPNLEIKYTRYNKSPEPVGWADYDGHASWMQVYGTKDPKVSGKVYKGHHGEELFKWMLSKSL
ncbi:hypothetical protein AAMO2058_001143100 [Amorphochlora amoebiformis]